MSCVDTLPKEVLAPVYGRKQLRALTYITFHKFGSSSNFSVPMAAGTSSWEHWTPSWADPDEDVPWPEDDRRTLQAPTAAEAGEELYLWLVELKLKGVLSARQTCLLAYYASLAGAVGQVSSLAAHPEKQSGEYSRVFDKAVPLGSASDEEKYKVSVASKSRITAGREQIDIPINVPHEIFVEEFLDTDEASQMLATAKAQKELPPAYTTHPLVVACPDEEVHPLCLYLDGVAFSRTDTLLGISVYHMLTQRNHVIAVLRKSEMCSCGCRGWDSLYPLLEAIAWSLRAMAAGRYPSERHDKKPWQSADFGRASFGGEELGWRAAVILIKGDWAEYAHSLGFPTSADNRAPCPLCVTDKASLFQLRGYSAQGMPNVLRTQAAYEAACSACEKEVIIDNQDDFIRVRAALSYDMRSHGFRGRTLSAAIPSLGLEKNVRLEPIPERPDPGEFDAGGLPMRTVWWRASQETAVRRRNPLFGPGTYVTPQCMSVDWLHTLSLGVFQFFLGPLFWVLLSTNAFRVKGPEASLPELGLARMKQLLFEWYNSEAACGRHHCRVQNITMSMLGCAEEPELKLHAAETNGLVPFGSFLLSSYADTVGAQLAQWRTGMADLMTILSVVREFKNVVPEAAARRFCKAVRSHMMVCAELGIRYRPKHHFTMHMGPRSLIQQFFFCIARESVGAERCSSALQVYKFANHPVLLRFLTHGSAAWAACWDDESANNTLRSLARTAHATVWHARVLACAAANEDAKRQRTTISEQLYRCP